MTTAFKWLAVIGFIAIVAMALGYFELSALCVAVFLGIIIGVALRVEDGSELDLIPVAQHWWNSHSNWLFAAFAAFPMVWLSSPDLQAMLTPKMVSAVAPVVAILGLLANVRKQVIAQQSLPKPTVSPPLNPKN